MTETYLDHTGVVRQLGHAHVPDALRGLPRYGANRDLVDESDYVEFDLWDAVPFEIPDQGQTNACNPNQLCLGVEQSLYQDGSGEHRLDPWFVFPLACQGDPSRGTSFDAVLDVLTRFGAPPFGTIPFGTSDPAEIPESAYALAARCKVELSEGVVTRSELMSAVMRRDPVGWPIRVEDGFDDLDPDGVPNLAPGQPNHAVNVWGGARHVPRWGWTVKATNPWGARWGQKGHFWLPVEYLNYLSEYRGCRVRAASAAVPRV